MLLNYLKLAIRLLARSPFFTFVNVVGLAIGFSSFYILWEYALRDLKSDLYHKDADRIARIGVHWRWTDDGGKSWGNISLGSLRPALISDFTQKYPEIESSTRILNQIGFGLDLVNSDNRVLIKIENQNEQPRIFKEEKAAYADPNLFIFFSIPLIYGEPDNVMSTSNDVVLSRSISEKYFGREDPRGKLIRLNDSTVLKVTGVYENLPHNSHLNFDFVISNIGIQNKWSVSKFWWTNCYVKLNHHNFKNFEDKLNAQALQYFADIRRGFPNTNCVMFVQPLGEIAFSQNFVDDNFYPKSKPLLFTLAFIALSVLVMAWVNYINLSVTRTSRRFKEVGTRKVNGAGPVDMVIQFLTESLVTNVLAIGLAFTLIQVVQTPVELLFNIQIAPFSALSFGSVAILVFIVLTGILLSGLYPALISIAHKPRALFTMNSKSTSKRLLPSLLTVSQLAAAIIFIFLGFVISLQLNYIFTMDTGMKRDQVVVIDAPVIKPTNYLQILGSIKKRIANHSHVSSIALSRCISADNAIGFNLKRPGSNLSFGMDANCVDEDFIPLYNIQLLTGRNFIKDDRKDAIIISRFAATRLGFGSLEEAVGSKITISTTMESWSEAEVIGVFEDFRVASFLNMDQSSTEYSDQGRGIVLTYSDALFSNSASNPEKISMVIQSANFDESIGEIKSIFEELFPDNFFNWYFLDEYINRVYANEKVARNQIILFTALAMVIACLGLLGMISNKVTEKTKEIGIRKVLGAELRHVAQILLNTTAKHVLMATGIGIPIGYYFTKQYLQKFSVHIDLQWWHFALPVLILVVIMFSTVAAVLWKAANTNPVDALKYD